MLIYFDSGANISCGLVLKIIEWDKEKLPLPKSLVMVYPLLDVELACWLPQHHINLLRVESTIQNLVQVDNARTDLNPIPSSLNLQRAHSTMSLHMSTVQSPLNASAIKSNVVSTELALTSRMAFFMDRIIAPEGKCSLFEAPIIDG
jgi:hypothetical protein